MSEKECFSPANPIYRTVMHSLHIIDVPLYLIVIMVLFRIKSTLFKTYKYYLIWHTLINEFTEFYNSLLMLPVVHLPYPLLRCTGILADFGFSGLFQFYTLSLLIIQTGSSIMEMFYFRYTASILDYKNRKFTGFIKFFMMVFRFFAILFPVLSYGTFFYSIELQETYKSELAMKDPSIPQITCYNSVLASPFSDSVMISTMITWVVILISTFAVIPTTTVYLNFHLGKDKNMSAGVLKMQKMLLLSLVVQTLVHGLMLGLPNVMFIYAIFFGSEFQFAAYFVFTCMTFHGLFSTIAMLYFTKPIQQGILEMAQSLACWGGRRKRDRDRAMSIFN